MQVLKEKQLYAKLSKCYFYQNKIHYLGHIVLEEGIAVDPKNIEAIMNQPTPNNVLDVRYFMGLASYYRKFIKRIFKNCTSDNFFTKERYKI